MGQLTLEPGHQYVRRDGDTTDPLEKIATSLGGGYPFWDRKWKAAYDEKGHYLLEGVEMDQDLVAEFLDPTKQRETVVPVLDEYASAIWA